MRPPKSLQLSIKSALPKFILQIVLVIFLVSSDLGHVYNWSVIEEICYCFAWKLEVDSVGKESSNSEIAVLFKKLEI